MQSNTNNALIIAGIVLIFVIALAIMMFSFLKRLHGDGTHGHDIQKAIDSISDEKLDRLRYDIDANNDKLKFKMLDATRNLEITFGNIITMNKYCMAGHYMIVKNLIHPLEEAVEKNNFFKVLAMDFFSVYRNDLIVKIKELHINRQSIASKIKCTITEYFQKWPEIAPEIIKNLDDHWLTRARVYAMNICRTNIERCKKCKPDFANDPYRTARVDELIVHYKSITEGLERRVQHERVSPERRLG